jgi:glycosyltransferase involved in cell wall biosynthesis
MLSLADVSLVIPVYNVESYLPECLSSVEAQTGFADLEIVIVDDGSTDDSRTITEEFAEAHSNVTLVRQENAGLGAARNAGLDLASRAFVAFLDSDDVLPADALLSLRSCVRDGVDLVVGRMETFPKTTVWPWLSALGRGFRVIETIAKAPSLIHSASACNKLFRRQFLADERLRFGEGVHFEDVYVTLPAMLKAETIALTNALVYRYRKRDVGGSIMDSVFDRADNYWDHLRVEEVLVGLMASLDEDRATMLQRFMVRSFQGFAMRAPDAIEPSRLREFFARARDIYGSFPISVLHESAIDARHRAAYAALVQDDFEFFSERARTRRHLRAVDGSLIIDRYPDTEVEELLRIDRVAAWIESVQIVSDKGRHLVVRGRFNIPGLDLREPPTFQLGLRVRGSGITVPAASAERVELGDRLPEQRFTGFEATIPIARLRSGLHHLRLVFITATGQASTRTRPSQGYLRSARHLVAPGLKLIPRVDRWDNCQVLVQRGRGRQARWRWRFRLVLEDFRLLRHRQPHGSDRVLRALTRPWFGGSDVWLLGERRDTAQDNSWALFQHLRIQHPGRRTYYILDRASAAFEAAEAQWGRSVVAHSSWRHRLLMLHAAVLIGSYDIDGYLLPEQWNRDSYQRHLAWRIGSRRVFLQHGVIYNDVSAALHKGITGLDLFVTSSPSEAKFVRERMGYRKEVVVTGLPRFDGLRSDTRRGSPRVLFMPTWRVYLVSPSYASHRHPLSSLEGSSYLAFLQSFVSSPVLRDALETHDATLEFLPHYEISRYTKELFSSHPHIEHSQQGHRAIQQAINECDLFVTDWSSTFFDAAYLGKPVVLAPFDEEEFYAKHYRKGYFSLEGDGFGPVRRAVDAAVAEVVRYLETGCGREQLYEDRASEFFVHRDHNNSARVVAAIDEMLRPPRRREQVLP